MLLLSSDILREGCVEGPSSKRLMGSECALTRTRNSKSKDQMNMSHGTWSIGADAQGKPAETKG